MSTPFVYKDDELLSTQLNTWHEENRKDFDYKPLFHKPPTLAEIAEADEDYLFCVLCGEPWSLEHVCWQVQRRRAITLAYTVMKEQR